MKKNTRRDFMKTLGFSIGAAGVAGGSGLLSSCTRVQTVENGKI